MHLTPGPLLYFFLLSNSTRLCSNDDAKLVVVDSGLVRQRGRPNIFHSQLLSLWWRDLTTSVWLMSPTLLSPHSLWPLFRITHISHLTPETFPNPSSPLVALYLPSGAVVEKKEPYCEEWQLAKEFIVTVSCCLFNRTDEWRGFVTRKPSRSSSFLILMSASQPPTTPTTSN